MDDDSVLVAICDELVSVHGAHTILLYGSRADGTASIDSDYDIAAYAPTREPLRIARPEGLGYLDVWLYSDESLTEATEESLRLRGSKVLLQRENEAEVYLAKVEALYRRGPDRLTANETEARKVWSHKMLARIERGDPEGNYRRVWLLQALLEDYFQQRGLWFEGPKKALRWLEETDSPAYHAYCRALEPGASNQAIVSLVQAFHGARNA